MSSYYGKQASIVLIKDVLSLFGWSIYGVKEDRSDSQSDYFDPKSWCGIAVKNGYVLVVDGHADGKIGGSFVRNSYDYKVIKRIEKLQNLANCPSAAKGEVENAKKKIEQLKEKSELTELIDTGIEEITYQKNPGNSKWHIEKNGKIVAKGTGVFSFESIQYEFKYTEKNRYFYTNNKEDNYTVGFNDDWEDRNYCTPWGNNENYTFEKWKKNVQEERAETTKKIDKLFNLVDKWNKLAVIKLGEGAEETLVRKITTKTVDYFMPKISDEPTRYIQVSKGWSYSGISSYAIFKLDDSVDGYGKTLSRTFTEFKDGTRGGTFKLEPRGNAKLQYLSFSHEKTLGEKHSWSYIKFVTKSDIFEVESWVKPVASKKKTAAKTTKKTAVKEDLAKEAIVSSVPANKTHGFDFKEILNQGELFDEKHTRTGDPLKVLRLKDKLTKDEFKELNMFLIKNKLAYYSKYVRGFILKEEALTYVNTEKKAV